jgi:hypothetical protein
MSRRTSRVAIVRYDDDIRFFELGAARFALWRSLARGHGLETAAARALARDPQFNLADEIVFLFRNRLVTGLDAVEPQKG